MYFREILEMESCAVTGLTSASGLRFTGISCRFHFTSVKRNDWCLERSFCIFPQFEICGPCHEVHKC